MRCSWLTLLLLAPAVAAGDILLSEDFEGDSVPGWRDSGRGTLRFTQYAGNTSVQLTRKKAVTLSLSTVGFEDVSLSMQLAAGGLEKNDSCHAELSLDAGKTWSGVVEVGAGRDDGVTLYSGKVAPAALSNNPDVRVRFRANGKDREDYCWGDNVVLSGVAIGKAAAYALPQLGDDFLLGSDPLKRPVQLAGFAVPDSAIDPSGSSAGTLQFSAADADGFVVHDDRFDYVTAAAQAIDRFPAGEFSWVRHNGAVIPVNAGVQRLADPNWELAFQAGRAWQSRSDSKAVRFSVPFALIERNANCTHNGVLTWLVTEEGVSSRAAYQVASETCAYFKFDMWGTVPTTIRNNPGLDRQPIIAAYEENRRSRLPVEPISALAKRFPEIDTAQLGAVANMDPADTSVYGLVVDGRHYRSACETRYGSYPFCDELLLPSFSTAKSIFAGLAVMRLEALQPGAARRRISELLSECDEAGWGDVTIENALDMATGRYLQTELEADESLAAHVEFIYAPTHAEKLRFACDLFPTKAKPGTVMVYHSSDTYLVGAALRELLAQRGAQRDIYQTLVVEPIWNRLELSPAIRTTRKTYDAAAQPLTGWGLFFSSDDIARIGQWLLAGAALPGEIGLDRSLYEAAMQQRDDDRGLTVGTPTLRYNNGFWALDIADFIGCKKAVWVPFMSGYGGISVVLFPNNTVYYLFADGYLHRWREAAIQSNKIRSMCQ